MPHKFQTLSHLSHLFFFETWTRGHTVSLHPALLRGGLQPLIHPVLTRTGPSQSSSGWTPFPFAPFTKGAQGRAGPAVAPPLFSLIAHLGLKCSANATVPHRCRSWLFLARICFFALISCFSASARFLFPPHSTPENCKFFSNTNFPLQASHLQGGFPAQGGLRGTE